MSIPNRGSGLVLPWGSTRTSVPLLLCALLLWAGFIHQACAADSADPSENGKMQHAASLHSLIEGAYYLINENRPERAVSYFKRAIELDPTHPDAYYFLGASHYRLGKGFSPVLGEGGRDDFPDRAKPVPPSHTLNEGANQFIAHALFYLHEAEKRGIQYDLFRPNLLPEIQRQYPDIQASAPRFQWDWGQPQETQIHRLSAKRIEIIVEGKGERGGTVSLQSPDGIVREFGLGKRISLIGGERYTIRFTGKRKHQLLKRLTLIGSAIAVWLLR